MSSAEIESRWYPIWEKTRYFRAGTDPEKPGFSIQLPPPNITGILHMGHAFNQTVMDTLTRYHRMAGYNTLWIPGTDHAGIATQIKVEEEPRTKEGLTRYDLGREKFYSACGSGRKSTAAALSSSRRSWASPVTGAVPASPWTRLLQGRAGDLLRAV